MLRGWLMFIGAWLASAEALYEPRWFTRQFFNKRHLPFTSPRLAPSADTR
jgi:hypothetical protein